MLNKKVNVKLLWMQFEDVLAPRLGLTVWDRAVYSYLLRHSLVVGKFRLHFAVLSVARELGLSNGPVRQAVRRLDELGALRLLERSGTVDCQPLAAAGCRNKRKRRRREKNLFAEAMSHAI
jgi:DNA-binding GntR family transcriptional regulator